MRSADRSYPPRVTGLLWLLLGASCVEREEPAPAELPTEAETGPAEPESTRPTPETAEPPAPARLDRTVLPIATPERPTYAQLDVRDVAKPERFELAAPDGAPNVVIILIDDFGFGVSSTFGGPVATPTMDQLAAEGLRYNNFHTTALCSPTRVALKTGRNHHMAETGAIMEIATSFPAANFTTSSTSRRPCSRPPGCPSR